MSNGSWDDLTVKAALTVNLNGYPMVLCARLSKQVRYFHRRRLLWFDATKEVLIVVCEEVPERMSQQLAQQG